MVTTERLRMNIKVGFGSEIEPSPHSIYRVDIHFTLKNFDKFCQNLGADGLILWFVK